MLRVHGANVRKLAMQQSAPSVGDGSLLQRSTHTKATDFRAGFNFHTIASVDGLAGEI